MHGFDVWWATERSAPTARLNCGCFNESYCMTGHYNETFECNNYWTVSNGDLQNYTKPETGDDSEFLVDQLELFVKQAVLNKTPFFVYLPFHTVHNPYIAVNPYKSEYLKKGYDENYSDYYGAITAMDAQVGRIRNLLQEEGVANNTLFWFASDNGPAVGSPGSTNGLRGRKGSLTEGGIRVPGLIEWPNMISENRIISTPVVSSDLLPTVLEILSLQMPDDRPVDGLSVLPLIQNRTNERALPVGFAFMIPDDFNGTYNTAWVDNKVSCEVCC
jgi:arylsulfatase A-like enzyme